MTDTNTRVRKKFHIRLPTWRGDMHAFQPPAARRLWKIIRSPVGVWILRGWLLHRLLIKEQSSSYHATICHYFWRRLTVFLSSHSIYSNPRRQRKILSRFCLQWSRTSTSLSVLPVPSS